MSTDTRTSAMDGGAEQALRSLADAAYSASVAPPHLAASVLGRARRARRLRRRLAGIGLAGAVLAGSVAAVTVGGGAYYEYRQPSAVMGSAVPVGSSVVVNRDLAPERRDVVQLSLRIDGREVDGLLRVVGVAGDEVACPPRTPTSCEVTVNGSRVDDAYIAALPTRPFPAVTVPFGSLFVLGDARDEAVDSRAIGPVAVDAVTGVAVAVIDGAGRVGPVPGAPDHAVPEEYEVDPEWPVPPASTEPG